MRTRRLLSSVLSATVLLSAAVAGAAPGEVLKEFLTPGSCPTGLTFHEESLWLADRRPDLLYQINPEDGRVVRSIEAPGYQIEGLASEGGFLWVADLKRHRLYQLSTEDGTTITEIPSPAAPAKWKRENGRLWEKTEP